MKYVVLGRSGIMVSRISMGTHHWIVRRTLTGM